MVGPAYAAMRDWMQQSPASERIAAILEEGSRAGSLHYEDGLHVNAGGIAAIAEHVEALATSLGANGITSDSCLCAGWADWQGDVVRSRVALPCEPRYGASFSAKTFREGMGKLWRKHAIAGTTLVFIAGNDLHASADPCEIVAELKAMKDFWFEWGVDIIYIDVVPEGWKHF